MNITSKGQVTIPKPIRDQYNLDENTVVDFVSENGRILLVPRAAETDRFERVRGRGDAGLTTQEILSLTRSVDE